MKRARLRRPGRHCAAGRIGAAGEIAHEAFVDWRVLEGEVIEVLGERQLGDRELYRVERACFSDISAVSRSPTKRCGSCLRLIAVASVSS